MPAPADLAGGAVGPQWTVELIVAASVLAAVVLASSAAWMFVSVRVPSMRHAETKPVLRLARTAKLNHIAAALTAAALIAALASWAWLVLANIGGVVP